MYPHNAQYDHTSIKQLLVNYAPNTLLHRFPCGCNLCLLLCKLERKRHPIIPDQTVITLQLKATLQIETHREI